MQLPPEPEKQRAALAGDPNCIELQTQNHPTELAEVVQAKLLTRRFGMPPDTAQTVARLAYGCGQ